MGTVSTITRQRIEAQGYLCLSDATLAEVWTLVAVFSGNLHGVGSYRYLLSIGNSIMGDHPIFCIGGISTLASI